MSTTAHDFRFFRAGGFDQVRLDTGADIRNLSQLDQKLWVALACPTTGAEFDPKTLQMLDVDGDGRLRVPDLLAAVAWLDKVLVNLDDLPKRLPALPLAAISDVTPEGRAVRASASEILKNLGRTSDAVTIEDTADTAKVFGATRFNGDGLVPSTVADRPEDQKLIDEIIATVGTGELDRSGKPGVSVAAVKAFFDDAAAIEAWWAKAAGDPTLQPLGAATDEAVAAFEAVEAKVEDYFTRCRLAAFDARATEPLSRPVEDWTALASRSLTATDDAVKAFPLGRIEPSRSLSLGDGVNPSWADAIDRLRGHVVAPLLGARTALTWSEWKELRARLSAAIAYRSARPASKSMGLGRERVQAILASDGRGSIEALIAQDEALRPQAEAIANVEKAVRLYRDFHQLLENFVTFRDFYTRRGKAMFQAGTLYLDGRACDLTLRVDDMGKHAALAGLSQTYLAYCECTRKSTGQKMTIAACFTGGDSDFLMVGRNGVFYDRAGNDFDATIVKVVENPLSIRQAFWSPYKRIGRLISDQIEKFSSSRDKAMHDKAGAGVEGAAKTAEAGPPPPTTSAPAPAPAPESKAAAAFDVAKFAGVFAAIGLALGAIGGVLAAVLSGFMSLRLWQMPLALGGVVLLISGPSMLMAWLKLRQRNLGPLLDAGGWAINARARINIPFGATLTAVAEIPKSAMIAIPDPFAEKKKPVWLYVTIAVVIALLALAWDLGLFKRGIG